MNKDLLKVGDFIDTKARPVGAVMLTACFCRVMAQLRIVLVERFGLLFQHVLQLRLDPAPPAKQLSAADTLGARVGGAGSSVPSIVAKYLRSRANANMYLDSGAITASHSCAIAP